MSWSVVICFEFLFISTFTISVLSFLVQAGIEWGIQLVKTRKIAVDCWKNDTYNSSQGSSSSFCILLKIQSSWRRSKEDWYAAKCLRCPSFHFRLRISCRGRENKPKLSVNSLVCSHLIILDNCLDSLVMWVHYKSHRALITYITS